MIIDHVPHNPAAAWTGYAPRPQVYAAPAPIGYGAAPASAGPLSSSSASSILGLEGFDPEPSSTNSRAWHDHNLSLNCMSAVQQ
jgi:hypothetical protein